MARTAPAPNIPPIPGMCPSIAVMGGGGGAGGGGGKGPGGGSGDAGAGTNDGQQDAEGDGKTAGSCGTGGTGACTNCSDNISRGDPIDVVSGAVVTPKAVDVHLRGPFHFEWVRFYGSPAARRDVGLGHGWTHSLAWWVEEERGAVRVYTNKGNSVRFDDVPVGGEAMSKGGWVLRREAWGYLLDAGDGFWHAFSAVDDEKRTLLTAVEDANKNRVSLTYEDGRLVTATDAAGRVIRFGKGRDGRIGRVEVQNAAQQGRWVVFADYEYDDHGDLVSATNADGERTTYRYQDHRLTSYTLPSGLTFHFRYDEHGRGVETWGEEPSGSSCLAASAPALLADHSTRAKGILHVKIEFGEDGYSEVVDSLRVQRFFANEHGTIDKAVSGGAVTTRAHDDGGHVVAQTDATGATSTFVRDPRGRLLKETDALGREFVIKRDDHGRVVETVDPAGGVSRCTRDGRGNALVIQDAAGAVTHYKYDSRGLLVEEVGPTGGRSTFAYDTHGNLAEWRTPTGAVWRWTYDFFGRPLSRTDPAGHTNHFTYTAGGKRLTLRDRAGQTTSYHYDRSGDLEAVVDPEGRAARFEYAGLHYLRRELFANGDTAEYRYNREGYLVEVENGRGDVHFIEYDEQGNKIQETHFDERRYRFRHDLMGRLVSEETPTGEKYLQVWNEIGQLVEKEYPDGTKDLFEYDRRGDLVRAKGPHAEVRLERDPVGRVVRDVQLVGEDRHEVESAYDLAGARARLSTSLGHTEDIERDAAGQRVRALLDGRDELGYRRDAFGYELARVLPSGVSIESEYDPMRRLSRRTVVTPSARAPVADGQPEWIGPRPPNASIDKAFHYDKSGRLEQAWDLARDATQYRYDGRGRLLDRLSERRGAEHYRYDHDGNLYEQGAGSPGRRYGTGDRLLERGRVDYEYDAAGRLVERRVRGDGGAEQRWRYVWNAQNLLAGVLTPDGTRVSFAYDPFARRVSKSVTRNDGGRAHDVASTRFVWDGRKLAHEVRRLATDAGDPIVEERTYVYDDPFLSPIAHRHTRVAADGERSASGWFHYVGDIIDTPEEIVDGYGAVVARLERSAFGRTEVQGATRESATPMRFEGQYADDETGLSYNRYRYYDPEAGRYISPDPIGLTGGLNGYGYALNPVEWVDPFGLYWPHTCTVTATTESGATISPPHPVYRDLAAANSQTSSGGGFYSGWANDGDRATMSSKWPGRSDCPEGLQTQTGSHTERKAMAWAEAEEARTGERITHMELGGQLPPCPSCHSAMNRWATERGDTTITYNYPGGSQTYPQ